MKNFGFVAPSKDEKDYVFGAFNSLPKVVLEPTGNWASSLPMYENQSTNVYETYGCVVFGTLNALETIMKKKTGEDYNFSERFIYNIILVEPPGTDPKLGADTIRKYGVVDQKELPMTSSLDEFKKPRPMSQIMIDKGHKWLEKYGFGYEYVFEGKTNKDKLKECLRYSPIGISVCAWYKNDKGQYYSPEGVSNNHWTILYGIGNDGEYLVFDTYDNGFKILSPDHNIQYAMRYYVEDKLPNLQQLSWFSKILDIIKSILNIQKQEVEIKKKDPEPIMETNEEKKESNADKLLRIADAFASKVPKVDITPNDEIPDDRACVSNLCELINEVVDFPRLSYTPTLVKEFKQDPRFKAKLDIEAGDILVNATVGENIGHTGIVGKNGRVMSGNSKTGNWEYNYTIDSWKKFFKIQKGLPTQVFRLQG